MSRIFRIAFKANIFFVLFVYSSPLWSTLVHCVHEMVGTAEETYSPLKLEACVAIALDNNPLKRAAEEGIVIAQEAVGEARALCYPQLDLKSEYSRWETHTFLPKASVLRGVSRTTGPFHDWKASVQGSYLLFDNGQQRAEWLAAVAKQRAAAEEAMKTCHDIIFEVHRAYYELLANQELYSVAKANLKRAQDHLWLAEQRKNQGAVTQSDVFKGRVEVAEAQLALANAEGGVWRAKGGLNVVMGLPPQACLGEVVAPSTIVPFEEVDLCCAMQQAMRCRPDLRAALQYLCAAEKAVAQARGAFGPKIVAEGKYGWRDEVLFPRDKDWSVGFSVEVPLFTGFALTHKWHKAQAQHCKERIEYQNRALAIQQEVWNTYSLMKEASQKIRTVLSQTEDAQETMRLLEQQYKEGAATIHDLFDAQVSFAQAEVNHVEAVWSYQIAHAALLRAVGTIGN